MTKEDWDFRACAADELEACRNYEFFRESLTGKKVSTSKAFLRAGSSGIKRMIGGMDEFPGTPWLKIPGKIRKKALKAMTRESVSLVLPDAEYQSFITDYDSVVVLDLDWRKSDNKLRKEFDEVLSRLRPQKDENANTGRRGRWLDDLNALGARRLLHHCKAAEAAIQYMVQARVEPLYKDERSLRRAAKKADTLVLSSPELKPK